MNIDAKIGEYIKRSYKIYADQITSISRSDYTAEGYNRELTARRSRVIEIAKMIQLEEHKESK